jgi:holo-[acyl-carrier protein] synthase
VIHGVGVDLVGLERFERALQRTPRLLERLFDESERDVPVRTLAGRFAAKEAFIKAIGDPRGFRWTEVRIGKDAIGKPSIVTTGATANLVAARGISSLHLSITHDAGVACAFVVAEGN